MALPETAGIVHLASEPGAGSTTMALQSARDSLARGDIVFWICREAPDGSRIGRILGSIDPTAASRFQVGTFGEQLQRGIESLLPVIGSLQSIGLVVIDDWADVSGRQDGGLVGAVTSMAQRCRKDAIPLLISSAMYEDADGGGWVVRGGSAIDSIVDRTWRLMRGEGSRRLLSTESGDVRLVMGEDGLVEDG